MGKAAAHVLLAALLPAAVGATAAHAAEPIPAQPAPQPAKAPGPGDPLPPIRVEYPNGTLSSSFDENGVEHVTATGGVVVTYGDLRITADQVEYTTDGMHVRATGSVVVQRGDESFRGEDFTFSGADGTFRLDHAAAISPPFYISGETITRDPKNGMRAENALFVPSADGRGELTVTAKEIQVTSDGGSLILRHTTVRISGRRIVTLPHLSFRIGGSETSDRPLVSIPLTFRSSGVAGAVVGFELPMALPLGIHGTYGAAVTTRTAPQYDVALRRDLVRPTHIGRERPKSVLYATPGGAGPDAAPVSPLRQIAIARRPPEPPDPVLDYDPVFFNRDPVARPLRSVTANLYLAAELMENRDIGTKRQGPLLLSRLPEVSLRGSLPLATSLPQDASNASLRRFLRVPRLQAYGSISAGRYEEHHLSGDHETVTGHRQAYTYGVSLLPLLVADHLLIRPQITENAFSYDRSSRTAYRFLETAVTCDYIFSGGTMAGFSIFRRDDHGRSPFTFDEVDTRNEAQIRGQVRLPGGKWTVGSVVRIDLSQGRVFSTEIAGAWRGKTIEPRLSYQTLHNQVSVGIELPGLLW